MKANELRIGNLVQSRLTIKHNKTNTIFDYVVYEIKTLKVCVCDFRNHVNTTHFSYEEISPIPLTEEWLLKFGFHSSRDGYYMKDGIHLHYFKDRISFLEPDVEYELQYVHQIQNLFHALTGKEL